MGMRRKEETHSTLFQAYANLLGEASQVLNILTCR
ncbi:hypothetical protein GQ55_3G256800 [Panicum hallii var. hallii]|uniref:Uncharacterized protein n=2 Tax=Panicum hallii TaxID=206008 RepID=A0A2T7EDC2_9POAL|nr:hypothetical protein PAHAL_3G266600 [Panicum hallii]PUZ65828.1 hypothetical protein GQ55_3G256800 [Panicum hallii var. hallii]